MSLECLKVWTLNWTNPSISMKMGKHSQKNGSSDEIYQNLFREKSIKFTTCALGMFIYVSFEILGRFSFQYRQNSPQYG